MATIVNLKPDNCTRLGELNSGSFFTFICLGMCASLELKNLVEKNSVFFMGEDHILEVKSGAEFDTDFIDDSQVRYYTQVEVNIKG